MNSFLSNPFTRNRTFPSVQFATTDAERNVLKVPLPTFSYEEALEAYRNMHVPNQSPDPTIVGQGTIQTTQFDNSPLAKDEWTKWRFMRHSSEHGDWEGDPFGRDEFRKEQELDRKSAAYAEKSRIENAKLSAELEKDDFRKQLLADIDAGKIFAKSKLQEIDESKNGNISTTTK